MGEDEPYLTEGDDFSRNDGPIRTLDCEHKSVASGLRQSLWKNVDPEQSTVPLVGYCFMTGFMDSITFTAVSVWCGFQTGNTIELAVAFARHFATLETRTPGTSLVNCHSIVSITCFLSGAFLGRIGDRMGPRTHGWLFFGTMLQAMCSFLAAILVWKASHVDVSFPNRSVWASPAGYATMAFASASMGLQGIMGKRINTQFATTVVLTTVWCELMADPSLFHLRPVRTRDLKFISVGVLFLGGFLGRLLLDRIGSAATFVIGGVFRILIAVLWLTVPCEENTVLL